jgi:fucose permease
MPIRATLALPIVWLGIALFFLYTGVEITAGRWSSSLFIEGRDIEPEVAGLWVSAYWGMFTVGRVAAGFIGRWLSPLTYIRLSMGAAVLAAIVLAWDPASWSGGVALGVMGFAFAPIFPILVSATPGRVGAGHAPNAIGFQIGAAGIGGSVIAGLTGLLAKNISIDTMPFLLLVANSMIFALHEIIVRRADAQPATATSAALEPDRQPAPGR